MKKYVKFAILIVGGAIILVYGVLIYVNFELNRRGPFVQAAPNYSATWEAVEGSEGYIMTKFDSTQQG